MDRLKDKVIVVTGAAMGQGAEEVRLFVEEGARVIAGDVATEALERVAAEVNALHPGHVLPVKLDVSSGEDWDALVAAGAAQFGKIDGLMNNAGIGTKGVFWEETSYELFKRVIDVNLWGQFRRIQAVVPEMRKCGGGSIVCVSSLAAFVGVGFNAYSPSKGGVRSLSRTASVTLGPENIRVNTIVPGTIETPMTAAMFGDSEIVRRCTAQNSLPRLGRPRDIAYGAVYLLSDEASYVTGTELVIDGGQRFKG